MLNIAFCDDDRKFLSIIVPKVESVFRHYRTDVHSYIFDNGNDLMGLSRILCKVRIRKKGMFVFLGAGQRFLASGLIRILAGNGCRVKGGGVSGRSFYP